jgi:glycosyltransferase involved in cell wall biosynthesis
MNQPILNRWKSPVDSSIHFDPVRRGKNYIMSRVMIIGYGPLPQSGMKYMSAPSLRTRHFLKPVLDAGHTVNLYLLPLPGTEGREGEVSAMVPDSYEGLALQRFTNHSGEFAIQTLTKQARQHKPDAIVGVNTYPSYVASMLATTLPVWGDLNGYWMAENQGRCRLDRNDDRLTESWAVERAIVRRVDQFSAVSRPQLHAVLGEMAATGRLNRHTFDFQFGHHIPNAAYRWDDIILNNRENQKEPVLRGPVVPTDAFLILWSGGFNVWCDVSTMVEAMDTLMAGYSNVHFVSTGGQIEGVVTETYQQFLDLIDASPHKDRYHALGWIESDKLPSIYREADLGINVDSRNYETMFGARNRINAMAAEELAIATTIGTEISEWLDDGHAVIAAPMSNPEGLAKAIEPWIEQREELAFFGSNALRIMQEDFSYEKTTRALIEWLESPDLAPDNKTKLEINGGQLVEDLNTVTMNDLERQAFLMMRHPVHEIEAALDHYHSTRTKKKRVFW